MVHHGHEETLKLGQAIRKYPRLVLYCLSLNIVVVGWGYDLIIVGSITGVDPFQEDYGEMYEGELIIPALWLSLWLASIPLGMAFGSIFAGFLQDRIGRKLTLTTASLISAVGVAILFFSYLAPNQEGMRGMFFAGKVIQGFAIGTLKVTALTWVSETAPTSLLASVMGLFPMSNLIGQLLGSGIVLAVNNVKGNSGYLGAFGSQWVLAAVPFVISLFIPESLSYLIAHGQEEKALIAARRLLGPHNDPERVLDRMRISIEEEKAMSSETSFVTCFSNTHRRRTWIIIMVNQFPLLFGLDLLSKSSYFMQLLGMDSNTSLILLVVGIVVGVIANATGVWVLSRVGRRKITMITFVGSALIWLAIGISGSWSTQGVAVFVAIGCISVIVVAGVGVWPSSYAVMGETSSLRLRAKSQGLGNMSQQATSVLMGFVLPYAFNPDAGDLGARTGFIYFGLCVIGVALTWFLLPEMKGRSIIEIDHMFNIKLPTRQFRRYDIDEAVDRLKV